MTKSEVLDNAIIKLIGMKALAIKLKHKKEIIEVIDKKIKNIIQQRKDLFKSLK